MNVVEPWSPYTGRQTIVASGRTLLTSAFADVVKIRTDFDAMELLDIFAAPVDDGENDACRDLIRLQADLLAQQFALARLASYARLLDGGESVPVAAGFWEIDDPLPRFATGCINLARWADPAAPQTHRLFVDSGQFNLWLSKLKPPGTISASEIEAVVNPQARALRNLTAKEPLSQGGPSAVATAERPLQDDPSLGPEWVNLHQVIELTTFGRSSILKWEKEGTFPEGIRIGSAVRWDATEVRDWVRNKAASRRP